MDYIQDKTAIKSGLMVHAKGESTMGGTAGKHVGTVDHLDGELYLKLTKDDSPDGRHRWIPLDWIEYVDDRAIYLNKSEKDFRSLVFNYFPGEMDKEAI